MRNRVLIAVAILWVAAVGAITAILAVTKGDSHSVQECYQPGCDTSTYNGEWGYVIRHDYDWGAWLVWCGGVTLLALVAVALIVTLWRKPERS